MAGLSADEFREKVSEDCVASQAVMRLDVLSKSRRQVRIRIYLVNRTLLDVYYSSRTGKTAFAQIKSNQRIFGADNSGASWHWHPYENPQRHDFTNREITFAEFLKRVEENLSK
jgi:hypothetical protein